MKNKFKENRRFVSAGACAVIAAFFLLAMPGYGFAALFFLLLAAALALFGLAGVLERKNKRSGGTLRAVTTAVVVLCMAALFIIEIPIVRTSKGDEDNKADYLIVLGAGVDGTQPSLTLKNRLEAALEYLNENPSTVCIVSGAMGRGEEISEAQCMYDWLCGEGVQPERIIQEDNARNTKENIEYSMALIEDKNATVAVVTSEYHLYRAKYIAEKQGVTLLGVPAKTTLPVLMLNYYFREAFAAVKMWVFG